MNPIPTIRPTATVSRRHISFPLSPRLLQVTVLLALSSVVVISMTGCAATRTTQSAGEYVDDAAITTSVKAALLTEDDVKSVDINVETFRGDVQLSGFVNSNEQIEKAIAVAKRQNGVKSVKNAMRIKTAN